MPSRHPLGVDTEPPDDDIVSGTPGGKLPLSAAQRRFEAATTGPSNRTFEVLKWGTTILQAGAGGTSNRTFEVLKSSATANAPKADATSNRTFEVLK